MTSGLTRPSGRVSRRGFLIGGATAATAVGAYAAAGWVDEVTYQPARFDSAAPPEAHSGDAAAQPIAILVDPKLSRSFAWYLGEVLRAEGLNAFQFDTLDTIDAARLEDFALVILPALPVTPAQVEALRRYVERGGRLIAMQPAADLAPLFGVRAASGVTAGGYVAGLEEAGAPVQVHAEASHYALDGGRAVADLYSDRTTPSGFPAVTAFEYGLGSSVLFAYDLPLSIALLRQGNPAAANQEHDGAEGVRANDMFVGWIDLDNLRIPQADVQARLLTGLVEEVLAERRPLPRLWYFPGDARSMIILTGDAHAAAATFIEETLSTAESFGGCGTVYYSPPVADGPANQVRRAVARLPLLGWLAPDRAGRPTSEQVADWRARGHEFGVHPYVESGVDEGIVQYLRAFRRDGYAPASPTLRTHRVLWTGWAETAAAQARRGFRMNVDYYHIGPAFQKADGTWPAGYFNGSGLPMKFVEDSGRLIDVYQQSTQLVDEHWLATTNRGWAGLDGEQAAEVARQLIDHSIARAPAALAIQYHMDFTSTDQPDYQNARQWLLGTLEHARRNRLPIWSAEKWLAFLQARSAAAFGRMAWDEASGTLSFELTVPSGLDQPLTVLLPATAGPRRLSTVSLDGQPVAVQDFRFGPRTYGLWSVPGGPHSVRALYESR